MSQSFWAAFDLNAYADGDFSFTMTRAGEANATVSKTEMLAEISNGYARMLHEYDISDAVAPQDGTSTPYSSKFADSTFRAAVQSAINTATNGWAGPPGFTVTMPASYNVAVDDATTFGVVFNNVATRRLFGYNGNQSGATAYAASALPYFIVSSSYEMSNVSALREPGGIASQPINANGQPADPIARKYSAKYLDFTQQYEVDKLVNNYSATETLPWTFEALFEHCRTIHPFVVAGSHFEDYTNVPENGMPVLQLRPDGANFNPQAWHPDSHERWHVPFRCVLVAWR